MFVLVKVQVEYVVSNVDLSRQRRNFVFFPSNHCVLSPPNQTCFVQKLACREESTANLNILYIDSKKKKKNGS